VSKVTFHAALWTILYLPLEYLSRWRRVNAPLLSNITHVELSLIAVYYSQYSNTQYTTRSILQSILLKVYCTIYYCNTHRQHRGRMPLSPEFVTILQTANENKVMRMFTNKSARRRIHLMYYLFPPFSASHNSSHYQ